MSVLCVQQRLEHTLQLCELLLCLDLALHALVQLHDFCVELVGNSHEYKSNTACAIGTLTFMVLGSATYLQRIFMMVCKPDAVRWDRAA